MALTPASFNASAKTTSPKRLGCGTTHLRLSAGPLGTLPLMTSVLWERSVLSTTMRRCGAPPESAVMTFADTVRYEVLGDTTTDAGSPEVTPGVSTMSMTLSLTTSGDMVTPVPPSWSPS